MKPSQIARLKSGTAALALLGLLSLGCAATAKELTIAVGTEPVADPHQQWSTINLQYHHHYYGYITATDTFAKPFPRIAQSYEVTKGAWRFKLRPGLSFDDGTALTADDVVASYKRAMNILSPGSFAGIFNGVTEIAAPAPDTVEIRTSRPIPTLAGGLSQVAIMPARVAASADQASFISGASAIGLGPYKFSRYIPGDRLVLTRNESYFGEKPEWDSVTFRIIGDPAARLASLLSGNVDVMSEVQPYQVDNITRSDNLTLHSRPSDRPIFLYVDSTRDVSPYVTGPDGETLTTNPLKDLRVRQAMSHAIDRNALRDRVMKGSFAGGGGILR